MENDVWLWLTRLGALTGFVAFMLKAWEFYRDRRPSLRVVSALSSDSDVGNTLTILNSSKVGTSIYHFTLEGLPPSRFNRLWPRFPDENYEHTEFDGLDRSIEVNVPAHGQASLQFVHGDHFRWGKARTADLYLRLWTTARRRSINFLVAPAGGRK